MTTRITTVYLRKQRSLAIVSRELRQSSRHRFAPSGDHPPPISHCEFKSWARNRHYLQLWRLAARDDLGSSRWRAEHAGAAVKRGPPGRRLRQGTRPSTRATHRRKTRI